MELIDAIKGRRSIRAFQNKEVEPEKIDQLLETAILAPSSGNTQCWEFIIVKEKEQRENLARAAHDQSFVSEAPLVIVVCANIERCSSKYGDRGETLYSIQDTANAVMLLMLKATELGLGTCWVGSFSNEEISKVLKLPEGIKPLAIIPLGYPAEEPTQKSRIPLEKLTHFELYSQK